MQPATSVHVATTIVLWAFLLSIVYGRGVPKRDPIPRISPNSDIYPNFEAHNHASRDVNVIPDYDWNWKQSFEWRGGWSANEKAMVISAAIGAADLMSVTMKVLTGVETDGLPQGEQDPSFSRYFRPGDMRRFRSAVEAQLAFLGTPGYADQRLCISASKVIIIHGEGPTRENTPRGCDDGERAYVDQFQEGNPPVWRTYMSICPEFFRAYKAHIRNPAVPGVSYVDKDRLHPYIDEGVVHSFEALSAAADFMHELFHVDWVYQPTLPYQIKDLYLTRPDNGQHVQAYRGYYAMKVKDPTWNPRLTADGTEKVTDPLYNVDSYVMRIMEIFYRFTYKRQPWMDSPDPKGALPWQGGAVTDRCE